MCTTSVKTKIKYYCHWFSLEINTDFAQAVNLKCLSQHVVPINSIVCCIVPWSMTLIHIKRKKNNVRFSNRAECRSRESQIKSTCTRIEKSATARKLKTNVRWMASFWRAQRKTKQWIRWILDLILYKLFVCRIYFKSCRNLDGNQRISPSAIKD